MISRDHILQRVRQGMMRAAHDPAYDGMIRGAIEHDLLELADALDQRFNDTNEKLDSISKRIGFPT